jgi:hypothetical protein
MLANLLVLIFNSLWLHFDDGLVWKKLLLGNIHIAIEVLAFAKVGLWSMSIFTNFKIRKHATYSFPRLLLCDTLEFRLFRLLPVVCCDG